MHFCIRIIMKEMKLTSNKRERKTGVGGRGDENSDIGEQIIDIAL